MSESVRSGRCRRCGERHVLRRSDLSGLLHIERHDRHYSHSSGLCLGILSRPVRGSVRRADSIINRT